MLESFSLQAVQIIEKSKTISKILNSPITGTEHLLLAMYETNDSICKFLLEEKNITKQLIVDKMQQMNIIHKIVDKNITFTEEYQNVILKAEELIQDLGKEYVFEEHLFYTILEDQDNIAYEIIVELNLDVETLLYDIEDIFNFQFIEEKEDNPTNLINLTKTKLPHPFFGRNDYLDKIKYILNKKQKNNPLLIGNPGVGKTTIIHALSKQLNTTSIYQLNIGTIISGTKYRGELEEKIIKTMDFIKSNNAILFIDEIHNIIGSGSSDGTLDIANILKPYLSSNQIKIIGATTLDEYNKYFTKDKALMRRFQNIYIDEPDEQETLEILKHIKTTYEEYHKIKYTNNNLKEIIHKTKILLPNKTFPDKAIDILDEIGSRYKIKKEKISYLIDKSIKDATGIKTISIKKLKEIKLNYPKYKSQYLKFLHQIEPVNNILVENIDLEFDIEKFLKDLNNVFSFKQEMFLEIDLSNYHDEASINNLIGSPSGYVGYEQGGILSEHINKYPLSVIYIKNLSQSHFKIQNFINKIINSLSFTDNKGRIIYLSNTIFLINKQITKNKEIGFIYQNNISNQLNNQTTINIKKYNKLLNQNKIKILNIDKYIIDNNYDQDFKNKLINLIFEILLQGKGEYILMNNYQYQKQK